LKIAEARKHALSLPGTTEEPHFHFSSFRVGGRLFATVPPGDELLHIFVPEEERERALVMEPDVAEKLFWGAKALGVRVHLPKARSGFVKALLEQAYAHKAAKTRKRSPGKRK
jgi:hypothetical protein